MILLLNQAIRKVIYWVNKRLSRSIYFVIVDILFHYIYEEVYRSIFLCHIESLSKFGKDIKNTYLKSLAKTSLARIGGLMCQNKM